MKMACCLDAVDVAVRESTRLVSRRLRSTQVNLRQHYKRWTGRAFRMRAACQKYDVPQCNRRRDIIDGGRNHYHFLAGADSAFYWNFKVTWSRRWRRRDAMTPSS